MVFYFLRWCSVDLGVAQFLFVGFGFLGVRVLTCWFGICVCGFSVGFVGS